VRKLSVVALSLVFLLSACAPSFQNQNDVVKTTQQSSKGKAIIPKYKISDKYYQTILDKSKLQPSATRGMVVANLNTRYDINEFETGLMRIAQNTFPTDKYYFQEGQKIDKDTVKLWLNRKFTPAQLKAQGLSASQNIGLNPLDSGSNPPIYLAHVLEQDYWKKDSDGKYHFAGVAIGLALNSIYYYKTVKDGPTYEKDIPYSEMVSNGRQIAQEIVKRLRSMKELSNIPITVGLFEQKSTSSVVPGNFIAYSVVDSGSSSIGSWEKLNEKYYLFPSTDAQNDHRDDLTDFLNFKQDVETYFPNFTGVIGRAFYIDDQLQELKIDIPMQFYGESETIGFTQYVAGLVMERFPKYISVSVSVTSVDGPEALISRKANATEPSVYIY
jgi:protein involved in sex pheromone biosynthesis